MICIESWEDFNYTPEQTRNLKTFLVFGQTTTSIMETGSVALTSFGQQGSAYVFCPDTQSVTVKLSISLSSYKTKLGENARIRASS